MSRIYLGNVVRLSAEFTNTDGEAVDPTEVTLLIQKPDGEEEDEITPTKAAVGSYYHDYTPATAGIYLYRFVGSGDIVAANEGKFRIRKSDV